MSPRLALLILLSACGGPNPKDVDPDDRDGDGYRTDEDCDDTDAAVHPDAEEIWYDGVDADCAGDDDFDADADGWVPALDGYPGPLPSGDCDDTNPDRHPEALETLGDDEDADCDGEVDGTPLVFLDRATGVGRPAVAHTLSHWLVAASAASFEDFEGTPFDEVGFALAFDPGPGALAEPNADVVWMGSTGTDPVGPAVDLATRVHRFYAVGSYTRGGAGYLQMSRVTWNNGVSAFERETTQDFRAGDPTVAEDVAVRLADDDTVRAIACTDTALQYADALAEDSLWRADHGLDAYPVGGVGRTCAMNLSGAQTRVHADDGTGTTTWRVDPLVGAAAVAGAQPFSGTTANGMGGGSGWTVVATDSGAQLLADDGTTRHALGGNVLDADVVDVDGTILVAAITDDGVVLTTGAKTWTLPVTENLDAIAVDADRERILVAVQARGHRLGWAFVGWTP